MSALIDTSGPEWTDIDLNDEFTLLDADSEFTTFDLANQINNFASRDKFQKQLGDYNSYYQKAKNLTPYLPYGPQIYLGLSSIELGVEGYLNYYE